MQMSDKLEKCVQRCVVVFDMSKFIPNKEHTRTALTFCFHLNKTAAESYRLLREAYGFGVSKVVTSKLQTRNADNRQKNSKMWSCKRCWKKVIRKHQNNSTSNRALDNKLFPIGYESWERFRRPVDGYHMS